MDVTYGDDTFIFKLFHSISLVYTTAVIAMTANIQTVALSNTITGPGIVAQVSGWGGNQVSGGAVSNALQRLTTTTITNGECISRFSGANSQRVTDNKICTYTRPLEGTCFGDEGGALVS